jgi:hypothetical protein
MAKKQSSIGLLALVTGLAAGAAAVFLSKKENRNQTKKVVNSAAKRAKKISQDFEKNPEKTMDELKKEGRKLADKAIKAVKTQTAKTKTAVKKKPVKKTTVKKS